MKTLFDFFNDTEYAAITKFSLLETNIQFAQYFHKIYPKRFIYYNNIWYSLNDNNIWCKTYKNYPVCMLNLLADTFDEHGFQHELTLQKIIKKVKTEKCDEDVDLKDFQENQKEITGKLTKILKDIQKNRKKCGMFQFASGVMRFFSSYYLDENVETKMDCSFHLFATKNCVYDTNTYQFRPIEPEDYITDENNTDYELPNNLIPNIPVRERIYKFLESVFDDDETETYFLETIARCMNGIRTGEAQKFYNWIGKGGNGKSLTALLLNTTFGKYYHIIGANVLTKTIKEADKASPSLVASRGKRIVMTSEPEASDILQMGLIKNITGGEEVEYRDLFKSNAKFRWTAGLFCQSNNIPKMKLESKDSSERRLEVLPFQNSFMIHLPKNPTKYQKQADDTLSEFLMKKETGMEFLLILSEVYEGMMKKLPTKRLVKPKCVSEATSSYFGENNWIIDWLNEHYELNVRDEENKLIREVIVKDIRDKFNSDNSTKYSQFSVNKAMEYNNIDKVRGGNNKWYYEGLRLKNNAHVNNNSLFQMSDDNYSSDELDD